MTMLNYNARHNNRLVRRRSSLEGSIVPASTSDERRRNVGHGKRLEDVRVAAPSSAALLVEPGSGENTHHALIRLVTRVLIDLFVSQLQRNHGCPGPRPRRRIVDRDFVVDSVRADARETFDDVQVLVRSPEVTLGRVIGRVDDQRVALPVTNRVTEPLPDV